MKKFLDSVLDWDRQKDVAKAVAEGRPICVCGWSCDDPELELCCDCFDAIILQGMLRGDYGKAERAEAKESVRMGKQP